MMANKRLKSGDVLQIPLPKKMGYAYAKYIDLSKIDPSISFPDMIRVFDYRTESAGYDFEYMKHQDYIIAPKLVAGLPLTIKQQIWKIIEHLNLDDSDRIIPHFSRNEDWNQSDPVKQGKDKWYYCLNADISRKNKTTYEKIEHLTLLSAIGTGVLETEVAMAFLIKEGKKVSEYFDLSEFYEKVIYQRLVSGTPYFRLPKESRDFVV
ncbi:MAG: hypothetical protein DI538_14965 [Azospira oryzae]|jgi:hypothetical protein|nr:MAG: hypothetical protein DI538_14965 [Azospira oryzae]